MADMVVGDCVEAMRELPDSSIDSVVTDPPYGIGFMGHDWDQPDVDEAAKTAQHGGCNVSFGGKPHPAMEIGRYDLAPAAMHAFEAWTAAWATEALRVLKPGGYLASFASTRTNHRHVCGIEDAGFEIRDSLVWLFGSGFPKSRALGDGRGTALKPGHEPIVLARKPFRTSAAANVAEHGTGGLNIDACRIPVLDVDYTRNHSGDRGHSGTRSIEDRGATALRMGGGLRRSGCSLARERRARRGGRRHAR